MNQEDKKMIMETLEENDKKRRKQQARDTLKAMLLFPALFLFCVIIAILMLG